MKHPQAIFAILVLAAVVCVYLAMMRLETPRGAPIGVATMEKDGTVLLQLRAEQVGGSMIGDASYKVSPADSDYTEILEHIGGLKPGETKDVPPWP